MWRLVERGVSWNAVRFFPENRDVLLMYPRWCNVAVVLLWLATMSWLVIAKVLPPLLIGDPPNYHTILAAQRDAPPVGWRMSFTGRPLGWALSTTERLPEGVTEIHTRVHFNRLPLRQMTPGWVHGLLNLGDRSGDDVPMDAENTLTIDALGRLLHFYSALRFDPEDDVIKVRGVVDGMQVKVTVSSGGFSFPPVKAYLPSDALLGDAWSPQTLLPGLHTGQTWNVPIYSPLRPPKAPLEILQATVEGSEPIVWDNQTEEVWLVVYRNDAGAGLGSNESSRGRLWVRRDGTVLRQEVTFFDSTMTFERLSSEATETLRERVRVEDQSQSRDFQPPNP